MQTYHITTTTRQQTAGRRGRSTFVAVALPSRPAAALSLIAARKQAARNNNVRAASLSEGDPDDRMPEPDTSAAAAGGALDPALLQAVEKLTQEVGGVKDQLAALTKVTVLEARWGRVRPALQALQGRGCPYGRGEDPYTGTTREMLEWALRCILTCPGSVWIDLDYYYRELGQEEYGYDDAPYSASYHSSAYRQPVSAEVVARLCSELQELTGLCLVVTDGVYIREAEENE